MIYKVRIIFDGVVAIGPAPNEDFSKQPGPLFAVMPRANRQMSRAAKLNTGDPLPHNYIPVHFPVVFTDLESSKNDRPPDETYPYKTHGQEYASQENPKKTYSLWYPVRERLIFRFDNEEDWGDLDYQAAAGPGGPQPKEQLCKDDGNCDEQEEKKYAGDIQAVANMSEIWPDRYRIRAEMKSAHTPAPHEVTTQVFVPRGKVSSGGIARKEGPGQCATFRPKRTLEHLTKCLVPEVVVTVEVETKVDILSFSLDTGEKLDRISFNVDRAADIWIGSADPADIRVVLENLLQPHLEPVKRYDEADYDFELYYQLLEGDDDGGGLPVPRAIRFGEPNCYTTLVGGGG